MKRRRPATGPENLDRAIAAYTQALQILTPERSAQDWAALQNDLGIAYQDRIRGERVDNLEKAITAFEVSTHHPNPRRLPA